ncbi:hypothetical protein ACS0TY_010553 [Phlomoides rotata]
MYNKRLKFSLEALKVYTDQKIIKFKSMQQTIHIDEKLINLTRTNERYYLVLGKAESYKTCQSKKIHNQGHVPVCSGKTHIFPFTQDVPVKKNSKTRATGTMETKD